MADTRKIVLVTETPDIIRIHLDDGEVVELNKEKGLKIDELKRRFSDPNKLLDHHLKMSSTIKWARRVSRRNDSIRR